MRTRVPPPLCSTLEPDGTATNPRWWARGDWRLQRRILTDDVKPIWIATLAERLCIDLAERPDGRDVAIINLTLGAVAQITGGRYFDVPISRDEWIDLRKEVYGPYMGAFSNRTARHPISATRKPTSTQKVSPGSSCCVGRHRRRARSPPVSVPTDVDQPAASAQRRRGRRWRWRPTGRSGKMCSSGPGRPHIRACVRARPAQSWTRAGRGCRYRVGWALALLVRAIVGSAVRRDRGT